MDGTEGQDDRGKGLQGATEVGQRRSHEAEDECTYGRKGTASQGGPLFWVRNFLHVSSGCTLNGGTNTMAPQHWKRIVPPRKDRHSGMKM